MGESQFDTLYQPPRRRQPQDRAALMVLFGIDVTWGRLLSLLVLVALLIGAWFWLLRPGPGLIVLSSKRVDALVVARNLRIATPFEPDASGMLAPGGDAALAVFQDSPRGRHTLVAISFSQGFLIEHGQVGRRYLNLDFRRIGLSGADAKQQVWFLPGLLLASPVQVGTSTLGVEQPVRILDPGTHRADGGLSVQVEDQGAAYNVSWDEPAVGARVEERVKDWRRSLNSSRWEVRMLMPLPVGEGPYELFLNDKTIATLEVD